MAQERPLDKDRSVGINAPVENLDVKSSGKYYPVDYSSMIAASSQDGPILAEIPKSFAGIVENFNEYRNNEYTEEEQRSIIADRTQLRFDLEDREHLMKATASNDVYDLYKQMDSDVLQLIDTVNKEDSANRTERVADLLDTKYKEPDSLSASPYAKELWASLYDSYSIKTLNSAKDADMKYANFRMKANISDAFNQSNFDVLKGADPLDSFNKFVGSIGLFAENVNQDELRTAMSSCWNKLFISGKDKIINDYKNGIIKDVDTAVNAVNRLYDLSKEYAFSYVDEKGNVMLDSQGDKREGFVTSTQDTQLYLKNAINDLQTKSAEVGATNIVGYVTDFKKRIGHDELMSTGFSPSLFSFKSTEDFDNFVVDIAGKVLGSSAKESEKTKAVREVLESSAYARAVMDISKHLDTAGGKYNLAYKDAIAKLSKDLNDPSITEWSKYKLTYTAPNGTVVEIGGPPNLFDFKRLGNSDESARLYWEDTKAAYEKIAEVAIDKNPAELLNKSNLAFHEAQQSFVSHSTIPELVSGDKTNDLGITKLVNDIEAGDIAAKGMGLESCPLANSSFSGILNNYAKASNPKEKYVYSESIATVLIDSNHVQDLFNYSAKNKNDANIEGLKALKNAVYLHNVQDNKTLSNKIKNIQDLYTDPTALTSINEALKNDVKYNETVDNLIIDNKIPASHIGAVKDLIKEAWKANHYLGESDKTFVKDAKALLNANFVEMNPNSKVPTKVFVQSPAFQGLNYPANKAYIDTVLNETLSTSTKGLSSKDPRDKALDLCLIPDEELGSFRLAKNKNGIITTFDTKAMGLKVGLPYGLVNLYKGTSYNPKVVGQINGFHAIANAFTQDSTLVKTILKKPDALTVDPYADARGIPVEGKGQKFLTDYYKDVNAFQKEISAYSILLNNPIKKELLIKDLTRTPDASIIQGYSNNPNSVLMRYFTGIAESKTNALAPSYGKALEQMRTTKFQDDYYKKKPIPLNLNFEPTDKEKVYINKMLESISYAGKVDQSNVSVPLSHAAIGNDDYYEMLATSKKAGFNISGTSLPGVLMDTDDDYEGPTGAAANIEMPLTTKKEVEAELRRTARKYGMDEDFVVAVARQESGLNPKAKSGVGAIGVMQLMPITAKGLGVDPYDARQNIDGGVRYLKEKYTEFGSYELALAAYNAGPKAVSRAKGIPNITETKNYVKNIMGSVPHLKGPAITYPVTYSFKKNPRFIDPDTNMLSIKALNDVSYIWNNGTGFKNKIVSIGTNRPELLENKPEYADYAKYRNMKNSLGKPLFVKSEFNGFKVNVMNHQNKDNKLAKEAHETIAKDMVSTQFTELPKTNQDQAQALLATFGDRYNIKETNALQDFGLANLKLNEYNKYGVPTEVVQNPIMQARVLNQEFQRAMDLLGSDRKAVYALAGGTMIDSLGNVKSWSEIKQDKEAFTKNWFIKPTGSSEQIQRLNAMLHNYEREYSRLRGYRE